jgi:hypothetical protein
MTLLRRPDKWYLGGGNRLQYAPRFPRFTERPGFWDEASYYNYDLRPLFTWTLVDNGGNEIPLACVRRSWDPSALTLRYRTDSPSVGVAVSEERSVLPNDVAVATIRLRNSTRKPRILNIVAWSALEHAPDHQSAWVEEFTQAQGNFSFLRHFQPPGRPDLACGVAFGANRPVRSFAASLSEGMLPPPQWELSPFRESFRHGRLPDRISLNGVGPGGVLFLAIHVRLRIRPMSEASLSFGMALAPSAAEAKLNLHAALRRREPLELSRVQWRDHFASVPEFLCSDPFLTHAYWYRWYGLRLNTIYGNDGNYEHPAVCEGIGYFRAPIAYSAPCHMLENRWMHEPELARGTLLTFLHNQREDGSFRGYIDPFHYRAWNVAGKTVEPFYHAAWGRALRSLDLVHPSPEFNEGAYEGLRRYAAYFDRTRDPEASGLFDVRNHYETGQEYMSRYLAVDPNADRENWGEVFRLKGVDATVYIYELKRELSRAAEKLGRHDEAELWNLEADRIREAVRTRMWDPIEEMFFDVNPVTGERTGVKAAVCFYPYFTDIVDESHLPGLKRHLFNPKEFWTPFPVPSTSADDPTFSAEPIWKGKRMNCPWNGRVWPMTNSHVAEAIAACAVRFNDAFLRKKAAEFITKYVRMMFFDGDPERPNAFEHYNPFTGTPSLYRGIDDYQHSWIVDLLIKYVCGVRPSESAVLIDPFPFGLDHASIKNVTVRGRRIDVSIRKKMFEIRLDGKHCAIGTVGRGIELQI